MIYLDYNSTTPVHPEVVKAIMPFLKEGYGNSASLHEKGRFAHFALEKARQTIGNAIGTEGVDIIFTSGGTESNNFAIEGVCLKNKHKGNHIITSQIEHLSVLETCKFLETRGFNVTYLPVDEYGMINPLDVKNAITDKTILVSVMHANNETGTIQPIGEIADIIKQKTANSPLSAENRTYFHTDAVQTFGKIPIDVDGLGIDLLSISAHKLYGPKGIGALYIRKSTEIAPLIHGGHQERDLRAGTVNIPGTVGFAKAVEISQSDFKHNKRLKALRDKLYDGLIQSIPGVKLNGHPHRRLYNTLNISFKDINSTLLMASLDLKGICVSAGSACASSTVETSHVLKAMSVAENYIKGPIRFSLGINNTDKEIAYCLKEIPAIVNRIRNTSYNK